ncbi:MAG: PQQ-binding-like beta-propeller repeat protein [Planctomycetes bacterium]|nr:PQQ-binding-like beta-propeller repeat protein [Planctomycetota bacterium]
MRMRMDMRMPEAIVVYVGGHVHAVEPMSGQTLWSTRLPKTYKQSIGTVLVEGDVVLAGVGGRLYCLDIYDGRLIWMNEMPGMGLGMVAVATPAGSANGSAQAAQQAANAQAAATAAVAASAAAGCC